MKIHSETVRSILPIASIAGEVQEPVTPGILATYHATDRLPDGQVIHLRAIRPSDRENLHRGFLQLSKASVRDIRQPSATAWMRLHHRMQRTTSPP